MSFLKLWSSLSPYSFDATPFSQDIPQITHDSIPIGAIPLLSTCIAEYKEAVTKAITSANSIYQGWFFEISISSTLNDKITLEIFV